MLSARHHVYYWILSIAAALVYQGMVAGLGFQEDIFRIILIPLMGFAVYLIWNGPGHLSSEWHVHQQAATACLMICLGSVSDRLYISGARVEHIKHVAHVLLAFYAVGALESVRQNRNDIQPGVISAMGCDIETVMRPLNWTVFLLSGYSHIVVFCLFTGIRFGLALGLDSIYGPEVSKESVDFASMDFVELYRSSLVVMYVLGSLQDAAGTVFYQIHRRVYPKLIPEPGPLLGPKEEWRLLKSSAADSFIRWVALFFAIRGLIGMGFRPHTEVEM